MFNKGKERFAKACQVVQGQFNRKKLPKWVFEVFRDAAYFHFGKHSAELPEEKIFSEGFDAFTEGFYLPFGITAVEDDAGIVILKDSIPDQIGLDKKRYFVVATLDESSNAKTNEAMISWGEIESAFFVNRGRAAAGRRDQSLLQAKITLRGLIAADPVNVHFDTRVLKTMSALTPTLNELLNRTFKEVAYFNMPGKFVVEVSDAHATTPDKKKICWTDERPRYTMLDPLEIRTLFGETATVEEENAETPEKGSISRTPHPRRRHRRTFRHDRYAQSGLRGHSIIVPATWVGPSEKVIGTKLYRVRLDR